MKKTSLFKNIIIICALSLMFFSCSRREERTVIGSEMTEDSSVTSVVESREPEISAGNEAFLHGDFEGAIEYYETGIRENRAVAYYNMGVSYYMMRDIRAAEEAFRNAVREDPNFEEAVMNLVAVLAEQGKTVEAEQYLSRLASNSKSARIFVDMANLAIMNNNSARARIYYEKALEIDRYAPYVISNFANYLISIGEFAEGERILNLLEEKDFAATYNLAYIAWRRGYVERAFLLAEEAFNMPDISEDGYDKLAALFADMKYYSYEAASLRSLINWNPKKEYRLRLVKSYIHSRDLDRASDEIRGLLADYGDHPDVIARYYEVLIARGEIELAGTFIRDEYQKFPDTMLFYYLVRHISLYDYDPSAALAMLQADNRDTPFINLARAAYYIRIHDYDRARAALEKVPETTYNDFYIFKSFISYRDGNYEAAERYAALIDDTKPEYFWYHFVLAWNLRKSDRLKELIVEFQADYITAARTPMFTYSLTPVRDDLQFTFTFAGEPADIAGQLLFPFFIEPDEMYSFLAMGYRLLREDERIPALKELTRSLEFSNAVIKNNEGVVKLMRFDYAGALANFNEAAELMELDPFVRYNIGLVHFIMGRMDEAYNNFDRAISLNRYMVPAYIGKAIVLARRGNTADANIFFEAALTNAEQYKSEDKFTFLPMLVQAKYLALIAQNNPQRALEMLAREQEQNNFHKAINAVAGYMINPAQSYLDTLAATNIYRSGELAYLLSLSNMPIEQIAEKASPDLVTLMMAKYIVGLRKGTLNDTFIESHMNNQTVLVDMASMATLLRKRAEGLRYLQMLSRIDLFYAPQYRIGLYYFTWIKDFPNAEATYTTLDRLQVNDRLTRYYMMLAFLVNYNQRRFEARLDDYLIDFPWDHRGQLMNAVRSYQNGNSSDFLEKMYILMRNEPALFTKMPLEINIERF